MNSAFTHLSPRGSLKWTLLTLLALLGLQPAYAQQMGGTYTVCPSGCDYATIDAALTAVRTNGVSGPVTINVAAGTYTEAIAAGNTATAAANRQITIRGAGRSATVLTSTAARTLDLTNSRFLNFEDMTIENNPSATTASYAAYLQNAQFVNFRNVEIRSLSTTSTTQDALRKMTSHNINVIGSRIVGGYYGFYASDMDANNTFGYDTIRNSRFVQQRYMGIYYLNSVRNVIEGNTVDSFGGTTTTPYPIYTSGSAGMTIRNNHINGEWYYGIAIFTANGRSNNWPYVVSNNVINISRSNSIYGIYLSASAVANVQVQVSHNTVVMSNSASTGGFAMYFITTSTAATGVRITNNIFARNAAGPVAYYPNNANHIIDGNQYWNTGGNMFSVQGTIYTTYPSYVAASATHGRDQQFSQFLQPRFVSAANLRPDPAFASVNGEWANIEKDFDGKDRCQMFPTAGAFENPFGKGAFTANFFGPNNVVMGTPTLFRNSASAGEPKLHRWYINGKPAQPKHDSLHLLARLQGPYDTISLVTVGCAGTDSVSRVFQVDSPSKAPVADFMANINTIRQGETVRFFDLAKDGPAHWNWNITPKEVRVGSTMQPAYVYVVGNDTSQNIEVRFLQGGSYTVCQTVSNIKGTSQPMCMSNYISVTPSINMGSQESTSASRGFLYDDGGPSGNYGPSRNDKFLIDACADTLYIRFHEFDTEHSYDYLRLFIGRDNTGIPVHCTNNTGIGSRGPGFNSYMGQGGTNTCLPFRGFNVASDTIVIPGGVAYLEFESDPAVHRAGFAMEWWSKAQQFDKPRADFVMQDSVCLNDAVAIKSTSTGENLKYLWDADGDLSFFESDKQEFIYPFFVSGDHEITLIVHNCGGYDTIVKRIHVYEPKKPQPSFTVDNTNPALKESVRFANTTRECLDSVRWVFTHATNPTATVTYAPGSSRFSQNPAVVFNDTGCWNVTLHAINVNGSVNASRSCYVRVRKDYCVPSVTNLIPDLGIARFSMGTISNETPQAQTDYSNYIATQSTKLEKGHTYEIKVERAAPAHNAMDVSVWIDWNQDGEFGEDELVASAQSSKNTTFTWDYTVPADKKAGHTVLRVAVNRGGLGNEACGQNMFGEYEDYRVIVSPDLTPPVITLIGPDTFRLERGRPFVDPGVTALDFPDGDVANKVVRTGWQNGNEHIINTYTLTYNVSDNSGNAATPVVRIVKVVADTTPPVIVLAGQTPERVPVNDPFWTDPGIYSAIDQADGDLTYMVKVIGQADRNRVGEYTIGYEVKDYDGNRAYVERTVIVFDDLRPEIKLVGPASMQLGVFETFDDPGVIITDNYYTDLKPVVTGEVDNQKLGEYTLYYRALDGSGNWSFDSVWRTITVIDTVKPVIVPRGNAIDTVDVLERYNDLEVEYTDNYDTKLEYSVNGTFRSAFPNSRPNQLGTYTIVYTVRDASGNTASFTRTVVVVDRVAPTIKLLGDPVVSVNGWRDYQDAGVEATDNFDQNLRIDTTGSFLDASYESFGAYYITYTAVDGSGNRSQPVTRTVFIRTSVEDGNLAEGEIKLFPNPTRGVLNIGVGSEGERATITIQDLSGRTVRSVEQSAVGKQFYQVDLSDLKPGTYIVRKQTATGVGTGKVTLVR